MNTGLWKLHLEGPFHAFGASFLFFFFPVPFLSPFFKLGLRVVLLERKPSALLSCHLSSALQLALCQRYHQNEPRCSAAEVPRGPLFLAREKSGWILYNNFTFEVLQQSLGGDADWEQLSDGFFVCDRSGSLRCSKRSRVSPAFLIAESTTSSSLTAHCELATTPGRANLTSVCLNEVLCRVY